MPRSVGTRWPSSRTRSPLSTIRLLAAVVDPARGDALEDPKAEEHLLEVGVGRLELLGATDRQLAALDHRQVLLGRTDVPRPPAVAVPVRARAEPDVGPPLPVPEVVPALVAGPRPVRDLVVAVAGLAEQAARRLEHVGLQVGVRRRHVAARHLAAERRRRLDRERVRADVRRRQRDRLLERPLPRLDRFPVRPVDQVEVHVVVARRARGPERLRHRLGLVHALQRCEHRPIERLRTHRQPAVPGFEQPGELLLVDRVGVRFDRDLRVRRHGEHRPHPREQRLEVRDLERRRRATAEEHADDLLALPCGRGELRFPQQRRHVSRCEVIQPGVGVEVAVAAPGQAERHVDVDAGGVQERPHFFFAPASARKAAMNASCGTSTRPTFRSRAFPFFCSSSSFRLRVMSPP